jgi:putative AbiEii toxin of type IV toxin-antitoxin system
MRFQSVLVQNFRGITALEMNDLQDMVVVAGPNGCGKSCILDAIRFLKSAYGGYQANEWHQWMGEFQIPVGDAAKLGALFQDVGADLVIEARLSISDVERAYLLREALQLLTQAAWRTVAEQTYGWRFANMTALGPQLRERQKEVDEKASASLEVLQRELGQTTFVGRIRIGPDFKIDVVESKVLELLFGTYDPEHVGVVDYHGPQRTYQREQLGGVNLSLDSTEQNLRAHALYNYGNKYQNVKSELAAGFVSEILARQAGVELGKRQTLIGTLKELFANFFPDKEFLGPQPTPSGQLAFPVRTKSGSIHDLNELSSGEKEILYGYLRLRNSAPKNSVILIDEPELHLNPRLTRGLPAFYHEHLGKTLSNQIWLITHSDAILRQAVGQPKFSVFHMFPPKSEESRRNQTRLISADELERAIIELVGDLASYRPGSKIVIFEGAGDPGFDEWFVTQAFPEFASGVNCISGEDRLRVQNLHKVLEATVKKGQLPVKIYSVIDKDSDDEATTPHARALQWDAYHIENYLLDAEIIYQVLSDVKDGLGPAVSSPAAITRALKEAARETLPPLVRHRLSRSVNTALTAALSLGGDPNDPNTAENLRGAIERSCSRIEDLVRREYSLEFLEREERRLTAKFAADLDSEEWKKTFQGREVLKRFVGSHWSGSDYKLFRDLLVAKMRDRKVKPASMKKVLDAILGD